VLLAKLLVLATGPESNDIDTQLMALFKAKSQASSEEERQRIVEKIVAWNGQVTNMVREWLRSSGIEEVQRKCVELSRQVCRETIDKEQASGGGDGVA